MAQSDRQPETTDKEQGATQPTQQIKWQGPGRFEPVRSSLRVKVTLAVLIPLLLIWGAITVIQVTRHQTAVLNSTALIAANAGHVIEKLMRYEIDETHFDKIPEILTITGENDNFRVVYLLDMEGNILFTPSDYGAGGAGDHLSNDEPDCIPCHRLAEAERPESIVVFDPQTVEAWNLALRVVESNIKPWRRGLLEAETPALMAGGGMPTGQVIGSTNRLAEEAADRPVHMKEVFATVYRNHIREKWYEQRYG